MWLNRNTNEVITSVKDVRINDIQYPSNIFWLWSESELNSIGIYKYMVAEYPNRRYYVATEVIDNTATPPTITYTTAPVDLESLKLDMITKINEKAKELMSNATAKYSPAEMAGWETLEREALQFIADGTVGSMLSGEATMSNQDITVLANEVIANANGFRAYRNFIVSTRYKKTQEVKAITMIDEAILIDATIQDGWM